MHSTNIQTHIPDKADRVYDALENGSIWPLMAIPFKLPQMSTLVVVKPHLRRDRHPLGPAS